MRHAFLPIKTVAGQNAREHHMARARRVRQERGLAKLMTPDHPLPCVVTVTRISAGVLDEHDNLRGSLKHVVDGIADRLGISDNDPRVEWRYKQEKCPRGYFGVKIELEAA